MVNLMLKEVHEKPVAAFGLDPRIAVDSHKTVEKLGRQRIADGDQAFIDGGLRDHQLRNGGAWYVVLPRRRSQPSALECIDVEQVDDVDMVQRELQAREKAGPVGFKLLLAEGGAGCEQPMVCPGIVVGERAIGLHKTSGHVCSFCDQCLLRIRAAVSKS